MFNIPVVIVVFNRPDVTSRLLACLEKIQPTELYVISDSARDHIKDEAEKVKKVRSMVDDVSWQCNVHRNYASENMGCMRRVSSGLDWVFSKVDRAIVLEDDCIPADDFFYFSEEMLDKYKDDERVMSISGTRLYPKQALVGTSYTFSKYSICWGWATWARAWRLYDGSLENYKIIKNTDYLSCYLNSYRAFIYWKFILNKVYLGKINSWAYRWMFSHWINNGLSIVPSKNLVKNIGVGNDATHTRDKNAFLCQSSHSLSKPFKGPNTVFCDVKMDRWIENNFYSKSLLARFKWGLTKLFNIFFAND